MISDYVLPITPKSERMLFAIEATEPARSWPRRSKKSMKTDPDAQPSRIQRPRRCGKSSTKQAALPMVTIENTPALGPAVPGDKDDEEKEERHIPPTRR